MAAPSSLLRGELYKADQMGAIFKLRWVELWAGGKGELRWGYPGPNAGTTDRGISDLSGATVSLGAEEWRGAEARFGFQVTPRSRPRTYFFQASSAEERRLWVDAIENVASPDVTRSNLGGGYRLIFMVRDRAEIARGRVAARERPERGLREAASRRQRGPVFGGGSRCVPASRPTIASGCTVCIP
mmetsp:Transcript_26311/g.76417  ORF Transcript_26311/g.76417 Transcript_26311/m.76417 type:complete len:186 (-) Transcript_26311:58-615(-)